MPIVWPEGWQPSVRVKERDVSQELQGMLAEEFIMVPEAAVVFADGTRGRIDFIAQPTCSFPVAFIGVEVKGGYEHFGDLTQALKQGIDYRHSHIIDKRLPDWGEKCPPFVFIYYPGAPAPHEVGSSNFLEILAEGAWKLAGRFNVGRIVSAWNGPTFRLGSERFWTLGGGGRADSETFATHRRPGNK